MIELLYNQSNEFTDLIAELNNEQRKIMLRILHNVRIVR